MRLAASGSSRSLAPLAPPPAGPAAPALGLDRPAEEAIALAMSGAATEAKLGPTLERLLGAQTEVGAFGPDPASMTTSTLAHVALASAVRAGAIEDPALLRRVSTALAKSWLFLAGEARRGGGLVEPLPAEVLAQVSASARSFHDAAYATSRRGTKVTAGLVETVASQIAKLGGSTKDKIVRYVESLADLDPAAKKRLRSAVLPVAALAAISPTFAAGFILSYVASSTVESFNHNHLHHASPETLQRAKEWGALGEVVKEGYRSHSGVHHGATFKTSYTRMFDSPEAKAKLDQKLVKMGAERIIAEDYGTTISAGGVAKFLLAAGPAYLGILAGLGLTGLAGAALPALAYVAGSRLLHPYLHMKKEDAMKKASAPMRWFLETEYAKFISRHHFVHHQDEKTNFNLMWGGDVLLGTHREPTEAELAKMREEEILM